MFQLNVGRDGVSLRQLIIRKSQVKEVKMGPEYFDLKYLEGLSNSCFKVDLTKRLMVTPDGSSVDIDSLRKKSVSPISTMELALPNQSYFISLPMTRDFFDLKMHEQQTPTLLNAILRGQATIDSIKLLKLGIESKESHLIELVVKVGSKKESLIIKLFNMLDSNRCELAHREVATGRLLNSCGINSPQAIVLDYFMATQLASIIYEESTALEIPCFDSFAQCKRALTHAIVMDSIDHTPDRGLMISNSGGQSSDELNEIKLAMIVKLFLFTRLFAIGDNIGLALIDHNADNTEDLGFWGHNEGNILRDAFAKLWLIDQKVGMGVNFDDLETMSELKFNEFSQTMHDWWTALITDVLNENLDSAFLSNVIHSIINYNEGFLIDYRHPNYDGFKRLVIDELKRQITEIASDQFYSNLIENMSEHPSVFGRSESFIQDCLVNITEIFADTVINDWVNAIESNDCPYELKLIKIHEIFNQILCGSHDLMIIFLSRVNPNCLIDVLDAITTDPNISLNRNQKYVIFKILNRSKYIDFQKKKYNHKHDLFILKRNDILSRIRL